MSEFINNSEYRQNELKKLIMKLHAGATVEDVREEFSEKFGNVEAGEIAAMEHALIMEGMPVENIQLLCDVHASVFKGSVREIHADEGLPVNHPVYLLKRENRYIRALISEKVLPSLGKFTNKSDIETSEVLKASLQELQQIDKHYARKEYLIFPGEYKIKK